MINQLILSILFVVVGGNAAAQAPDSMDATAMLLEELSNAHGPSGFEGPVRTIIQREMEPLVDRIEMDGLGSVIGIIEHSPDAPNIMIAAHLDEVGMMVKADHGRRLSKVPGTGRYPAAGTAQPALQGADLERLRHSYQRSENDPRDTARPGKINHSRA